VQQLSWTDDMMLRAERPATPLQIQLLLIYDRRLPPAASVGIVPMRSSTCVVPE
jgi:diacylglycerol O-acyltransferase